ncbi:MAG TPA: DUF4012 domain-containing protein [Microbacterium sp.]|uniref:DUF4012 domain-containing protein n=1 Tax=Microbacterium sp. TaxID=51671 RepID=UPI002B45AB6E|nr:DUF4012 domain-containing protein [Microbacterium sp.]HKT55435.1 DUF4012 domain-containing protein [Microbacterium sp.]
MPADMTPETPDAPRGAGNGSFDGPLGLWDGVESEPAASSRSPRISSRSTPHHSHGGRHRSGDDRSARRRRRRRIWISVGAVVFVLLVGAGIAGFRFMHEVNQVKASLASAQAGIATLSADMKTGDQKKLSATAGQITGDVESAVQIVDGPLWGIAAQVPMVGQNVDAVRRVTRAVNILAENALPPGLEVVSSLNGDKFALKGGGLNLAPFRKAQDAIPDITDAFRAAQGQIAPINQASLMPVVAKPVAQVASLINGATPTLESVQKYLPTLLDIIGGDGKKTYLLIFQNNAEIRATGGNPAASMIMTVDNGKFKEAGQAGTATFVADGTAGIQFTKLPPAVTKLYFSSFPKYEANYTMTPNFPTTARLLQDLWKHSSGQKFDGVISIDPVVLSHMLAVAGPVKLATGDTVTSANAVKLLLSDAYERYPTGPESDAFFADVSKRVFDHLTSTPWDPTKMLEALTTSAQEQRIYLNFTDPKAQALAVQLGLDGSLQTSVAKTTQLGMYLNDSSVGKLEYHLTSSISAQCNAQARTITEYMTLHNSIPDTILSNYTLGGRNWRFGLPRTTMILDVVSFAPPGATIVKTVPKTGEVADWERSGIEDGNTAVSHTVFVPQGKSITVSYTVKLPGGKLGPLDLRHSPTARDTKVTIAPSCGQLFGGN